MCAKNSMNLNDMNEYQLWTRTVAVYPPLSAMAYLPLGLAGEAGEVANKMKKILRDGREVATAAEKAAIIDELGDVMWYVARIADQICVPFSEVLEQNVDKLNARMSAGTLKHREDK